MFQIKSLRIINFRSIEDETIHFGENKTVFVGKNGSGKTSILKAIEKLFYSKKIKAKDFKKPKEKLLLKAILTYEDQEIKVRIEAENKGKKVVTTTPHYSKYHNEIIEKVQIIYIPGDRKINTNKKENGYIKLIDLILTNKEYSKSDKKKLSIKNIKENIGIVSARSGKEKTTLLITLLRLYLYSLNENSNKDFKVFLIDQPENFLHPHATKMIDSIIQKIGELENTQVFYSTHSPELVSNFRKGKYEIDDIVFVKKDNGTSYTKKIDNRFGRFNKIMINLIFKNASIFFSDAVILVEGETEKISIPNIYENTDWSKYGNFKDKNLTPEEKENYFNLNYKNISVIDVGGKGSLYEWYVFASELFGKNKVYAVIDRDENYYIDRDIIFKTIRKVYNLDRVYEDEFHKYNWIVLDGEFENHYKVEAIRKFIADTVRQRMERSSEGFQKDKYRKNLRTLDRKLAHVQSSKKISTTYEHIFNLYFNKYSKPTIAFNLSIRLSKNNGYDEKLLQLFRKIIEKFDS